MGCSQSAPSQVEASPPPKREKSPKRENIDVVVSEKKVTKPAEPVIEETRSPVSDERDVKGEKETIISEERYDREHVPAPETAALSVAIAYMEDEKAEAMTIEPNVIARGGTEKEPLEYMVDKEELSRDEDSPTQPETKHCKEEIGEFIDEVKNDPDTVPRELVSDKAEKTPETAEEPVDEAIPDPALMKPVSVSEFEQISATTSENETGVSINVVEKVIAELVTVVAKEPKEISEQSFLENAVEKTLSEAQSKVAVATISEYDTGESIDVDEKEIVDPATHVSKSLTEEPEQFSEPAVLELAVEESVPEAENKEAISITAEDETGESIHVVEKVIAELVTAVAESTEEPEQISEQAVLETAVEGTVSVPVSEDAAVATIPAQHPTVAEPEPVTESAAAPSAYETVSVEPAIVKEMQSPKKDENTSLEALITVENNMERDLVDVGSAPVPGDVAEEGSVAGILNPGDGRLGMGVDESGCNETKQEQLCRKEEGEASINGGGEVEEVGEEVTEEKEEQVEEEEKADDDKDAEGIVWGDDGVMHLDIDDDDDDDDDDDIEDDHDLDIGADVGEDGVHHLDIDDSEKSDFDESAGSDADDESSKASNESSSNLFDESLLPVELQATNEEPIFELKNVTAMTHVMIGDKLQRKPNPPAGSRWGSWTELSNTAISALQKNGIPALGKLVEKGALDKIHSIANAKREHESPESPESEDAKPSIVENKKPIETSVKPVTPGKASAPTSPTKTSRQLTDIEKARLFAAQMLVEAGGPDELLTAPKSPSKGVSWWRQLNRGDDDDDDE